MKIAITLCMSLLKRAKNCGFLLKSVWSWCKMPAWTYRTQIRTHMTLYEQGMSQKARTVKKSPKMALLLGFKINTLICTYMPWDRSIFAHICRNIYWNIWTYLKDIYCIYGVFSCYIQQYSPSTSAFFRPRPAPQPRHFFVLGLRPRTKKCLGWGTILVDIVLKHTVYPLHILYLYILCYIYDGYTVCLRTISNVIVL